jgi:uncharacterized membrane protein HdeD (DUF308 family)
MSTSFPYFLSTAPSEATSVRGHWGWVFFLGIVMILVGVLAIAYPVAATLTTVKVFGFLLLFGGLIDAAGAFWVGRAGGFLLHLLCGVLTAFLGLILLDKPVLGAAVYTLVLAVFFVATGLFRIVLALSHRFSGWGWVALNGAVGLFLGVLIWRELPEAALWVIGTFVGIDLLFNGLSWVMLGLGLRTVPRSAATPAPPPTQPLGAEG